MLKCLICNNDIEDFKKLSYHLRSHKISSKDYYDKYLKKENEGICPAYGQVPSCKKQTSFNLLSNGYLEFCSLNCMRNSDKTKNKRKETNIKRYGNVCSLHGKEIRKKTEKTWNEKYGGNPRQNEEIKNKVKKTMLEKYGVEYSYQVQQNLILIKINKLLENLNLELLSEYTGYINSIKVKCKICNLIFETNYNNLYFNNCGKCPKCFPRNKSKLEIELLNFIKSIEQSEIIENSNNIIQPYELDIFIPSKNIAIEFNGLYWHSENKIKDKNYHLNKTNLCIEKNIQLINIFEDEWIFKQDIVKSRLKQILGVNNSKRIHARNCIIKEISPKIKNEFLNKYHIQGGDRSITKLGSFYNDELISIMTFSHGSLARNSITKDNQIWELSRFCSNSNYHIPGIASKLLSHFKKNYEWKEIYSYADRRWSKGNLYSKIGFELGYVTKPNYFYTKGLNRIHRFNLRKLPDEPKDIPEWILRQNEGYFRIWDCGHYKFIMDKEN